MKLRGDRVSISLPRTSPEEEGKEERVRLRKVTLFSNEPYPDKVNNFESSIKYPRIQVVKKSEKAFTNTLNQRYQLSSKYFHPPIQLKPKQKYSGNFAIHNYARPRGLTSIRRVKTGRNHSGIASINTYLLDSMEASQNFNRYYRSLSKNRQSRAYSNPRGSVLLNSGRHSIDLNPDNNILQCIEMSDFI